ncbi:MAG: hypothetical protein ACERLM_16145, partial [Acidimicrobiales bacterium]
MTRSCTTAGSASARPAAELAAENSFLLGKYADAAKAYTALAKATKDTKDAKRFALRVGQSHHLGGDY